MDDLEFIAYCRSRLQYNPATGVVHWRNGRLAGKPAGSHDGQGYRQINLKGRQCRLHRILWMMENGPIPDGHEIDHVNRIRSDNRICNLRLATRSNNVVNGVRWRGGVEKHGNKYRAALRIDGRKRVIGTFDTEEEALSAAAEAHKNLHGEFSLA